MNGCGVARGEAGVRVSSTAAPLDAAMPRNLLEQLEQLRALALAQVTEQLALHPVGDPLGLLDQRRA